MSDVNDFLNLDKKKSKIQKRAGVPNVRCTQLRKSVKSFLS